MSKKINNPIGKLPKEINQSLKGFEDVFEDYVQSEEYKANERKEREKSKADDQYELQHFLEQENDRLTSLEVFLTKKIPLKINFSQTDKLIKHQRDRKSLLQQKLNDELSKMDSSLQKNLAHFFNAHFS